MLRLMLNFDAFPLTKRKRKFVKRIQFALSIERILRKGINFFMDLEMRLSIRGYRESNIGRDYTPTVLWLALTIERQLVPDSDTFPWSPR